MDRITELLNSSQLGRACFAGGVQVHQESAQPARRKIHVHVHLPKAQHFSQDELQQLADEVAALAEERALFATAGPGAVPKPIAPQNVPGYAPKVPKVKKAKVPKVPKVKVPKVPKVKVPKVPKAKVPKAPKPPKPYTPVAGTPGGAPRNPTTAIHATSAQTHAAAKQFGMSVAKLNTIANWLMNGGTDQGPLPKGITPQEIDTINNATQGGANLSPVPLSPQLQRAVNDYIGGPFGQNQAPIAQDPPLPAGVTPYDILAGVYAGSSGGFSNGSLQQFTDDVSALFNDFTSNADRNKEDNHHAISRRKPSRSFDGIRHWPGHLGQQRC